MSENQEQKSQSEDTFKPEVVIEPMAAPYRAILSIGPEEFKEVRRKFDRFWDQHEEAIVEKYKIKGRKMKGGKMKDAQKIAENNIGLRSLYSSVIIEILEESLEDFLFIEDVEMRGEKEDFTIYAKFYYNPRFDLEEDPDFKVVKTFEDDIDVAYKQRLEDIKRKYRTAQPYEGDEILEEHNVLVDIIANCDGEPYEKGTVRNRYYAVRDLPEELRASIIAHKKGDLWETTYLMDERDPDMKDKQINVHVKLHDVQEIIWPEVTDELAKEENFDDLEAYEKQFREDYTNYIDNARRGTVVDHVMTGILAGRKHPEIPQSWLDANVQSLMKVMLTKFQGNKERMSTAIGAKDEKMMYNMFKGEALKDLTQLMALRAYARYYDIDLENQDDIINHMVEKAEWVEREEPKA